MADEEINKRKVISVSIILIAVILVIIFWSKMTVTITAGHAGVLFKTFGGGVDTEKTYSEGFHFIAPWNKMYKYETRQQETSENMKVLSSNGLEIIVDLSAWYKPKFNELGLLHAKIGTDYLNRVIIPSLRASARSVIGRYTPDELYSTKRDIIQDEIFAESETLLAKKYVFIDKVLIRAVILPPTIKKAIETKLKQEQEFLEYKFKLDKAKQEAERQRIEADGKAIANKIINASLTDKVLREKGLQATLELAKSNNAKIVIIGNSKDGMPLILGDSK